MKKSLVRNVYFIYILNTFSVLRLLLGLSKQFQLQNVNLHNISLKRLWNYLRYDIVINNEIVYFDFYMIKFKIITKKRQVVKW